MIEWLIAGAILLAGLTLLPWWLATRSDPSRRGGGIGSEVVSGLAEQLDPRAAMITSENEKREMMEGEQDSGDPEHRSRRAKTERES